MLDDRRVGHEAGWFLNFRLQSLLDVELPCLAIGAGDYHADIQAALPGGLDGGTYRFVVEGITNEHFQRLDNAWSKGRGALLVDLYLNWRDIGGGAARYLSNLAGLGDGLDTLSGVPADSFRVARLVVCRLSRRVGQRRYEAVVEAREAVYERLSQALQSQPSPGSDPLGAALEVARLLSVDVEPHRLPAEVPPAEAPPVSTMAGSTGLQAMADLDIAMSEHYRRSGRGMLLIRDGKLHIGPNRIPLHGTEPVLLDDSGGLVQVETTGISQSDANLVGQAGTPQRSRQQFTLTLKGRPDLRPGDVVQFVNPAPNQVTTPRSFADAVGGLLGSFTGASDLTGSLVQAYVSSVSHVQSRSAGFVTTLAVVETPSGDEWDEPSLTSWRGRRSPDLSATPDGKVADAIGQLVGPSGRALAVGEVRAAHLESGSEPPSQTVDLWVGLAPGDGLPFRARRLPVARSQPSRLSGVPYVTPFAWGKCGLVLPRYPGTRVVLGHRGGDADDPLELGALWESGHGPDAQAGDWWLSLPAAVPAAARGALADASVPEEPTSHASHDLTDADGARVIEVGRLTIRVLPSQLPEPGVRPVPPEEASQHVTIEHQNGSRIVISENGDITIESKGNLTLSATKALNINADQVNVKVTNTMDVS